MDIVYYKQIKLEATNEVKNRIRELRREKHITQEKIVENIDITRQYISLLENSEIEPSMSVANGIAKALGKCIYEVFDVDGTGAYFCSGCKCNNHQWCGLMIK